MTKALYLPVLLLLSCLSAQALRAAPVGPVQRSTDNASRAGKVAQVSDLCAPCNDASQCEGLCPKDVDGTGLCSQRCDEDGNCPTDFTCTTSAEGEQVCYPDDETVCPSDYVAAKNTYCALPATADNPNASIVRKCADGLTCYRFPSADGTAANLVGVCVSACSSVDARAACAPEETCCFGTGTDGSCIKNSSTTQTNGGCFVVGDVGGSCAKPDHSYCSPGAYCGFTQTASAATCFARCSSGSCPPGGYCQTVGGVAVCCDARALTLGDITTCVPQRGVCRREVGVVCSVNADCRLNLCQKNGTKSACSVACQSDDDCPGPDQDANGDGVPDGGGSCLRFGDDKRCWPLQGPAAAPKCATLEVVETAKPSQGCQCASGGATASLGALALPLLWLRLRRRVRGAA